MTKSILLYAAAAAMLGCTSGNAATENSTATTAAETAVEQVVEENIPTGVVQLAPGETIPEYNTVPVVVDFFATWCGPCRAYGPVFDKVAEEMAGKAVFVRVDVDENGALAAPYNVTSIPTTVVLRKGQKPGIAVGMLSAEQLTSLINGK